jgi:tRNA (guanine37-N1)-methyltransferase
VERWRRRESLRATRDRRPDLFARLELNDEDRRLIEAGDDEL